MPIKAIVMALVSLGATFGVLVGVFQHGWLSGLLDTHTVSGLSPFMLGIAFAFALGLSMDYEVFLLSRITEYVDAGHGTDAAFRYGLQRTGRIITASAVVMLVVLHASAPRPSVTSSRWASDCSWRCWWTPPSVRCLLVPATMTLLGRWNWWAPRFLRRWHDRYGVREHQPEAEPVNLHQPVPGSGSW